MNKNYYGNASKSQPITTIAYHILLCHIAGVENEINRHHLFSHPLKSRSHLRPIQTLTLILFKTTEAGGSTDSGSEPELDSDTGSQTHLNLL